MSNNHNLKQNVLDIVARTLSQSLTELSEDGKLSELEQYIPNRNNDKKNYKWNINKLKIVLEVLKLNNPESIKAILSYLDHSQYGWHEGKYRLYNTCLLYHNHCKKRYKIDNTEEATSNAFAIIDDIFLHRKYGGITTYLFGYCLAALFSSCLKSADLRVPYFLQIACERNSNTYRLIHEIVSICDVNTGSIKNCGRNFKMGYCDYEYMTVYPNQSVDKSLGDLLYCRDIPVVIDGYENEKFYSALLRETANISGKVKPLDIKEQFNTLPIFICSAIRSHFKNVFSIDLTGMDIDEDYLEIIQNERQHLASWVLELVLNGKYHFSPTTVSANRMNLRTENHLHFYNHICSHIDYIQKYSRKYINLTRNDVINIGFLTYFFVRYMEIFEHSIQLTEGKTFEYKNEIYDNPAKLIRLIINNAATLLFSLHDTYSPTLPIMVNINTYTLNTTKSKLYRKKWKKYASDITKYYQNYGVSLKILPDAEFKDDRYIFSVKLLPGTNKNSISYYADEVRRLLGVEFFLPEINHSSIKIIVSEKPLKENSLCKILNSFEFQNSKMQLPYAVGYDIMGQMVIADIAEFPHMLIGGTSGSGKSSALHSLLMSIVCKQKPAEVRLLLLDFGASRLRMFEKTPHMLSPVITVGEVEKGKQCILYLRKIMEQRLKELESIDERNITRKIHKWPSIICVIDEFPTFIRRLTEEKKNKKSSKLITDLLERARKVKIHLILAAQDATKDNIEIKTTNLGAAIAFRCITPYNSRAIIGNSAATTLSGKGSMYFKCDQHEGIKRLQGAYMPPEEIIDTLDNMNFDISNTKGTFDELSFKPISQPKLHDTEPDSDFSFHEETHDEKLAKMIIWLLGKDNISNKQIKDEYKMGYDKANTFLKELEDADLITSQRKGAKLSRTVIPQKIEDIPANIINLLNKNGYSNAEIINALNKKSILTDTQFKTD